MISKWRWVVQKIDDRTGVRLSDELYTEADAKAMFGSRLIGRLEESKEEVLQEHTGWVNIDPKIRVDAPSFLSTPRIFNTKEDALANAKANGYTPAATIEIQWQE